MCKERGAPTVIKMTKMFIAQVENRGETANLQYNKNCSFVKQKGNLANIILKSNSLIIKES